MYIFRWLMKHPVIILALYFLSIVAILFSMTNGGSSDKKADVAETAQVLTTESAEVDLSEAPAIEPSTLTTALVTGDSGTETEASEAEVKEAVETDNSDKEEQASTEAAVDTTEVADSTETSEVMSVASTATENTEVESETQFEEANADELLLMAREAYWNNGLEESAQIYQQLIELNPDIIDYKGELGNVYWRQGFPKKAAELYAEISVPMIEEGNADRVANMVGFIGLYFPEKATDIHNLLQAQK